MPEGTHLLPPPDSVLELAASERGALARAVLRREEFLGRTDEPACGVDMRTITNRVVGKFVDLRGLPSDMTQIARPMLGKRLYEDSALGADLPGYDALPLSMDAILFTLLGFIASLALTSAAAFGFTRPKRPNHRSTSCGSFGPMSLRLSVRSRCNSRPAVADWEGYPRGYILGLHQQSLVRRKA